MYDAFVMKEITQSTQAKQNILSVLGYLREIGIDIDAESTSGQTVLDSAVELYFKSFPELTEKLICLGADSSKFLSQAKNDIYDKS